MWHLKLPKVNVNEDSATVVAWAVEDGARVAAGDVVCSVETDKATLDLESEAGGFLRHRAKPGQECAVQEVLGFVTETPDEPLPERDWLPLPEVETPHKHGPVDAEKSEAATRVRVTLRARRLAAELGVDPHAVKTSGVVREADVRAFAESHESEREPPGASALPGYRATILGTGSYLPEQVMTNNDVISIANINTSDEWIRAKIGIEERRFAGDDEATSDLALFAARRALESAGVAPDQIGMIVLATTVPDRIFPATACIVQGTLGCPNAMAFDVSVMCTGTVYALDIARRYIEDGSVEHALVIGSEVYSRMLDFTDRSSCIYFGDGAGAMVVGRAAPGEPGILTSYVQTDGTGYETITALAGGTRMPATLETVENGLHYFRMDPKGVWNFATGAFPRAVRTALERAGVGIGDVDFLISHQANINIIQYGMDALGLPMSKTHTTLHKYGNTSGASVAIALDEAHRMGKIRRGDLVVLVGFGGGLAWGAAVMRWTAGARG
jgi:3-oxoacyl-[acyl-carrier-protein] synthase-3